MDLKTRRKYHGTIIHSRKIYVFGGGTANIEYYDDNKWNEAGTMTADRQSVTCWTIDNLIFIASKNSNTIEEYNTSTNETRLIPADYASTSKIIGVIQNELYIFSDKSKIFKVQRQAQARRIAFMQVTTMPFEEVADMP